MTNSSPPYVNPETLVSRPGTLLRRREARIGLLFLTPWLLGYLLLKLFPILTALWYSFTNFDMLKPDQIQFIGLENYAHFAADLGAWSSLAGSLGYFVTTIPLELLVALSLAAIFSSRRVRGKSILRPLIFMPSIIPLTAIYFIFVGFVDPQTGWLNRLIMSPLGLPPVGQGAAGNAFFVTFLSLWSIGPGFLIMLAAMQGVPPELYEAARMDGAGPLMRLLQVTIPLISPAIFFSLVIDLSSAFGGSMLFDRGYFFSTSVAPMQQYIDQVMFMYHDLGYAAALAWVTFIVTMTLTVLLFRSALRWVYFPDEAENEPI